MFSSSPCPRGGQPGNINTLKHGFYTRRLKKRDLTGVESTDVKTLIEEISLVRVFTRRLIETLDPAAGAYEIAAVLRILCVSLKSITSAMKAQHWLSVNNAGQDDELNQALKEFWADIEARRAEGEQASKTLLPPQVTLNEPSPPRYAFVFFRFLEVRMLYHPKKSILPSANIINSICMLLNFIGTIIGSKYIRSSSF